MIKIKKLIAGVASVAIVLMTSVTSVQAYDDVSSWDWFSPYVEALADAWIFDGSKDMFRASDNMNRAEFVKTMVEAAWISTDDVEDAGFSDISSQWFAKYVNAAAAKWIIDGPMSSKGNKFSPSDNIARAAAVKIALWAFWVDADDYQSPATSFNDTNGHWGEKFITASYNLSIVDWMGGSNTTFAPNDNISRAAVAKVWAFSIIVSDDPSTYVRFEDWTSAFSPFTASDIKKMVWDIVGVDTIASEDPVDDDTPTTSVNVSDWSLEISVSADSPKWAVIPYGVAWVEFAKFDLTANWDDILVSSITLTRKGLWERTDFTEVVLFDDGWTRISKTKTFNSDDEAVVTLDDGWLLIWAWETKTVSVKATIAGAAIAPQWNRDAITVVSASSIASNSVEVVWDFPLNWSTFEIGSQGWGEIIITTNWSVAAVKLWETDITIMKFKVGNDNVEDIDFNWITLKEIDDIDENGDLGNFKLYNWSDLVATTNMMTNKYLTFKLDESVTIDQGKTEKFSVTADILWWASKNIHFTVDKALDVSATWRKYGYWAAITWSVVTGTADPNNVVSVKAWDLTFIKVEPVVTKVRKNKDNVEFWKFKIVTNAGKNLEFEQLSVTIYNNQAWGSWVLALLENIEVYDESKWTTYELWSSDLSTATTITATEADLWIALTDWETRVFTLRADTLDNVAIDWALIKFEISSIWSVGVKVKETDNDEDVIDVTPSILSYKSVEWTVSAATLTLQTLSAAKNVVIWSDNIVALDFEVEWWDTSDVVISELTIWEASPNTNTWFANQVISEVKLWKKEWTNETLIDSKWGSQISSNSLAFDNLNVTIPMGEKVRFVVTVSVAKDSTKVDLAMNLKATFSSSNLEDEDWDDVTITPTSVTSARTLTLVWIWSLQTFAVDNDNDVMNNKAQNAIAWEVTDFIASFELKWTNEDINIKDLLLTTYIDWSEAANMNTYIESFSIYWNDKVTLLATETVDAVANTEFENINLAVAQITSTIYVKAKLNKIWDLNTVSQETTTWFTLWMKITDAEWVSSWDKIMWFKVSTSEEISDTNYLVATWSNVLNIVATKPASVELITWYDTTLVTWNNNIAFVKIAPTVHSNATASWNNAVAVLQALRINVELEWWNNTWASITEATIKEVNGNTSTSVTVSCIDTAAASTGCTIAFSAAVLRALGSDIELSTARTYKITVNVTGLDSSVNWQYIKVSMDALDGTSATSNVSYKSCKRYMCTQTVRNSQTVNQMLFKNKSAIDAYQISTSY